jgi:chorismate mutase
MSTAQELARLRRLRSTIERAQARIKELSDARDEIIADLLIERTATGDAVGAAAGVSQPRTVQIKNSVLLRRETAALEAQAKRDARRARRQKNSGRELLAS